MSWNDLFLEGNNKLRLVTNPEEYSSGNTRIEDKGKYNTIAVR